MYYYILDENSKILNSIILEDSANSEELSAIADDRIFNIGDIWTAPPTELEIVQQKLEKIEETGQILLGDTSLATAAEQTRRTIQLFAATLPEEQMMEVAMIFPVWETGHSYAVGDIISYGKNSVGDPQLYKVVQAHTSAAEWKPSDVPALYDAIGLNEGGYPVWSQPSGAHDAYNKGDIVDYKGTLYRSLIDGNVWSPDSYPQGWEVYKE